MKHELNKDAVVVMSFVDTGGRPFEYDLREELSISDATLIEDLQSQPAKYAWWASVLERARVKLRSAEDQLDYSRASISNEIRASGEKLAIAVVNDRVAVDPDYKQALQEVRYWEGEVGKLVYIVRAFEQRRDMLIQKSSQYKASLRTEAR